MRALTQQKNPSRSKTDISTSTYQRQTGQNSQGNEYRRWGVQFKLRVNQPGDKFEQEADQAAAAIMYPEYSALPTITSLDATALQCQVLECPVCSQCLNAAKWVHYDHKLYR